MSEKTNFSNFTYSEFVEYAINTPRVKGLGDTIRTDSDSTDYDFTKTKDLEEAIHLARYGWDSGIKEMELEKELIVDGQMECYNSIIGSTVDVGAFLSGDPECMIQFVDKIERDKPELTIYAQLDFNGGVSSKDALEYAKKALKIIVEAETKYSVRLIGVFATDFTQSNIVDVSFISIKEFYQQFVLNSLAFSFHPSFLRRIWFRYAETLPYLQCGYGRSSKFSEVTQLVKQLKVKNSWLLPNLNERGLKWTEEDIIKF